MSKENVIKELKAEFLKFGAKLGVAILRELSKTLGDFAGKIENSEAKAIETSSENK